MSRILVTGAAGFLGYHLAHALSQEAGNSIVCADNGIRGASDDAYARLAARDNVEHFDVDLCDPSAVERLPADIDVIYHLAALNGTQNFYERPFEVLRCCTLPTLNLVQRYGPPGRLRRFVYAGTSEAYASTVTRFGWPVPTAEDVPLSIDDVFNPRWSYAMGKMHGEVATITGCGQFGLDFSILRYHNAYGPRMGDKHVVPDFYNRARNGVFALYGYEDTRSFIYVDDAIAATIAVANAPGAIGEIVNVGGAREITIEELGRLMMEVAGLKGSIEKHPSPAGSVRRRCPDVGKLLRLTGFQEKWSLEAGLAATAKYYLGARQGPGS
jgi:nucleoside-diphosphate-sugar epimerase